MDSFLKNIPGLPCRVIVNDVADYTSREATAELSALIEAGFTYTGLVQLDDDPVGQPQLSIVVLDDFIDAIPMEQAKAVLYHEVGHVVLGHVEHLPYTGVLKDINCELAADEYAATMVSATAMYEAIKAAVNFKVHVLAGIVPDVHVYEEVKRKLSCPLVATRLKALKVKIDAGL